MIENPVRRPIVPPIRLSWASNFSFLSLTIWRQNWNVKKGIWNENLIIGSCVKVDLDQLQRRTGFFCSWKVNLRQIFFWQFSHQNQLSGLTHWKQSSWQISSCASDTPPVNPSAPLAHSSTECACVKPQHQHRVRHKTSCNQNFSETQRQYSISLLGCTLSFPGISFEIRSRKIFLIHYKNWFTWSRATSQRLHLHFCQMFLSTQSWYTSIAQFFLSIARKSFVPFNSLMDVIL